MMDSNTLVKLVEIAKKEADITTLEWQHVDSLDFHDLSVGQIKRMLLAAYELGVKTKK